MGLLDFLNTGDPEKDAAISRGLLSAGLALMQSRGKFLPSLSQGGFAGLQSYDADRQRQYQQKLQKASLDAIARKKMLDEREDTLANLPGQYIKPASQGNNPSAYTPGSADIQGLIERYMATPGGLQTGLALSNAFAKPKPTISKPGDVARDESGNVVWENPAAPNQGTPLAQLIAEQAKFPRGSAPWKIYEDAIAKASTHQPAVNVSYGAPIPAINPKTGEPELYRPDNKGGMTPTGIKPPPQHRDTKLPAELQRMQIAGDTMESMLNDYEAMLKKYNPRDPLVQANPRIRADLTALKRNIELQFKELQALGALAGPDIDIMREALADPLTFSGAMYGTGGLMAQVKRARDLVRLRKEAVLRSQGKDGGSGLPSADAIDEELRRRGQK